MDKMIEWGKLALGAVVTAISAFFGGMDGVMYALLIFISIDYLTGVAVAIKQKQLSSEVGFWGLVRKVCILALVGVAHIIDIDVITTGDVFRTAVSLYYIGNEGISILENTTLLGVKYPEKLMSILQQIRDNAESDSEE